ncbi:MAG TPA: ABC transporter permease, partial [Vineibacter sp.]|nr:ABC transporter permease [Vineibacter sp.]
MPEPAFLFGQFLGGLTAGMFLFTIAAGLSLIFGVLRVLNFAHGSFYMFGAYLSWQVMSWVGPGTEYFWLAALAAALGVTVLGVVIEYFLLRHLYQREELYQLLFTYALVLILADGAKILWGTGQLSVSRPPSLSGSMQ